MQTIPLGRSHDANIAYPSVKGAAPASRLIVRKSSRLTIAACPDFNSIRTCGKCLSRIDSAGHCLCNLQVKSVKEDNTKKEEIK